MAKEAETTGGLRGTPWRVVGWGTAALLLLLPLVTNAPWTAFDFVSAGVIFGGVGLAFELIVRKSSSLGYRSGAALAVVSASLTILVNGAVGVIGPEDNPYNLLFLGVLLVALIGSVLARFEAAGMMRAMAVAAATQGVIGAIGLTTDVRGGVLSVAFAGPWLLSAALFRKAAREQAFADAAP